jgi:hypothetical protein
MVSPSIAPPYVLATVLCWGGKSALRKIALIAIIRNDVRYTRGRG